LRPSWIRLYRRLQDALVPERWLVRRFIARHLPSRAPAVAGLSLDIGGGTAPFAPALQAAWPHARHLVSDRAANDRVGLLAEIEHLPIADARLDLVTLFQMLQHVFEPHAALAECRRVLRPDGLLLLTYPFLLSEGRSRDLWRWTSSGIERQLQAQGFEIVAHEPCGGPVFMVTALLAALPGRLLIVHRSAWRAGRSAGDAALLGAAFLLALPFHLLGLLVLPLDRLFSPPAHHIGGAVLARRRVDG